MAWWMIPAAVGAAYSAIKGGQNQGKANDYQQQAIDLALRDYNDRAPLRMAFQQGALGPIAQAPNLSSVYAGSGQSNPFWSAPPASAHVGSQLDFSQIPPAGQASPGPGLGVGQTGTHHGMLPSASGAGKAKPEALQQAVLQFAGGPRQNGETMSSYIQRIRAARGIGGGQTGTHHAGNAPIQTPGLDQVTIDAFRRLLQGNIPGRS